VDNRPGGAGGTVGAKAVANANADGYTLLFTPAAPLVTAPLIYRNLGYDPFKSFTPVAMIFSTPQMLVVTPSLPVDSMAQLASYAIANPGKVSFASPGFATQPHLLGEMFRLATGANIVHVPYKGAQQALTDLMTGQVQMFFDTVALFLPHVQAGKVKPLAIADDLRSDQLPAVPTTAESGFPTFREADALVYLWSGGVSNRTKTSLTMCLNYNRNSWRSSVAIRRIFFCSCIRPDETSKWHVTYSNG